MTGMYGDAHENMRRAREQNVRINNQTGEPSDPNANANANGGDPGQLQFPKVEEATLVMPDGTTMKAADYSPYQTQAAQIEKDKAFVEGMKSALSDRVMNTEVGDPNGDGDPGQQQDDDPFASLTGIEVADDEYTSENEKKLAAGLNSVIGAFKEVVKTSAEGQKQLAESVQAIGNSVSQRAVAEDLQRIEAQTGVTQDEIVAASEQTGITDVNTLARLVLGAKAEEEAIKEATENANGQRLDAAGGVAGTTHGGGGNPVDPNDFYKRPEVDYDNNAELLKHYRLANVGPPRIQLVS